MATPGYGTPNLGYFGSWFEREDPGGPMWALNLMKYRPVAQYADGRDTTLTGAEADDEYAPIDELAAVGARILFMAPVVHQLVGDDTIWDRIAIAQYPTRMAMVEMNQRDDFKKQHAHKEAGMESTIVMASFPYDDDPAPDPTLTGEGDDQFMLLHVVADASAPDLAADIESIRIGRFWIEDYMIGDGREFAEARWDLISKATADELAALPVVTDDSSSYAIVIDPKIDRIAHSLSDPTSVLL